ncbi:putative PDDEXK endonuclease [Marinobacter salarius]|uniref:putative PDDEXK endonuclease n=1 Tax=Marinobacter salarius TaxID=1420917 RepID=UPI003BAA044A
MPSPSKNKGNQEERAIAQILTDLYQQTFVRVPTSGAWTGGKNQHRAATLDDSQLAARKSDIQPPTGWKINIEIKHYADLPFHNLIKQDCKQLDTWIDQLEQVSSQDDVDIIFFKISRKGRFVAVKHFPGIDTDHSLHYKNYYIYELNRFFENNKQGLKNSCT